MDHVDGSAYLLRMIGTINLVATAATMDNIQCSFVTNSMHLQLHCWVSVMIFNLVYVCM